MVQIFDFVGSSRRDAYFLSLSDNNTLFLKRDHDVYMSLRVRPQRPIEIKSLQHLEDAISNMKIFTRYKEKEDKSEVQKLISVLEEMGDAKQFPNAFNLILFLKDEHPNTEKWKREWAGKVIERWEDVRQLIDPHA